MSGDCVGKNAMNEKNLRRVKIQEVSGTWLEQKK